MSDKRRFGLAWSAAALVLLGLVPVPAPAADKPAPDEEKRCAAGTCVGEAATMLRREALGKPWRVVTPKETLQTGDLLVGGGGAVFDSQNGAVRVDFLGDLAEVSPFPVRECAVVLRDEPSVDLAFTLDRGRVDVSNRKDTGAARVRVHVRQDTWELTLAEPGATIALELYGRWPPGAQFTKEPGPKDVPTANLVFLVVKGEVMLKHGVHEHALKAPPGPALIEWDSVNGMDHTPHTLKELPPWAREGADETPLAQRKKKALAHLRHLLTTKSLDEALDDLVNSDDPDQRRMGVMVMGAVDDLPRLARALRESQHPDVWDNGVLALRHWIGRGPGQDQILYKGLVDNRKFSPATAEAIVQLLHSFGEEELARPETYEALIDYLDSDHLPLRGLAYWHLKRLVPAGEEFGYKPTDPQDKREAAVEKWKKLIPNGKLPPRPGARAEK
jgi:hypothetical protein